MHKNLKFIEDEEKYHRKIMLNDSFQPIKKETLSNNYQKINENIFTFSSPYKDKTINKNSEFNKNNEIYLINSIKKNKDLFDSLYNNGHSPEKRPKYTDNFIEKLIVSDKRNKFNTNHSKPYFSTGLTSSSKNYIDNNSVRIYLKEVESKFILFDSKNIENKNFINSSKNNPEISVINDNNLDFSDNIENSILSSKSKQKSPGKKQNFILNFQENSLKKKTNENYKVKNDFEELNENISSENKKFNTIIENNDLFLLNDTIPAEEIDRKNNINHTNSCFKNKNKNYQNPNQNIKNLAFNFEDNKIKVCNNCKNHIDIRNFTLHSLICDETKYNEKMILIEKKIKAINEKINRFLNVLISIYDEIDFNLENFDKIENLILMLIHCFEKTIRINNMNFKELIKNLRDSNKILKFLKEFNFNEFEIIFTVSEKIKFLISHKIELGKFLIEPKEIIIIKENSLENQFSENKLEIIELNNKSNISNNNGKIKKEEENAKRKRFFLLANEIKKKLPKYHSSQSMIIQELYDQMIDLNIQEQQWRNYIQLKFRKIE